MKFKTGDVVIKNTGGNKMTIIDFVEPGLYKCMWFVDAHLNESNFKEEEIITLEEYKRLLKTEEREDKIGKLLK
jgi:uncharacterized protein YodC (DUF2158 family)